MSVSNYEIKTFNDAFFDQGLAIGFKQAMWVRFGKVSDSLQQQFNIDQEVYFADFNWDVLLSKSFNREIAFQEIPKFPSVRRDFALLLDQSVTFEEIEKIAFQTERKILQSVTLFDVYEGKNLPKGKKSYGVGFVFLDKKKTLTDGQVDKIMERLQSGFEKELKAELR